MTISATGPDAERQAIDQLCVKDFCTDGKTQFSPYFINQTRACSSDSTLGPAVHFDDVRDIAEIASREILERMQEDEDTPVADVVLFYGGRVLAVIQYSCGDGLIVWPEMQPHY